MFLIVGLGNPGQKFQKSRHNLGFRIVEELVKKNKFSHFGLSKQYPALISQGILNKEKVIVAEPQTFMNNSGRPVKRLKKNLKLRIENLIVVHDDLDLPLGKIKISRGRGTAGHRGVESIIKELKSKNFSRLRIGIQPQVGKPKNIEKFVLQKFNKKEEEIIKKVIEKTLEAIKAIVKLGLEKAMSQFN